jgi:hypothetical protein
MTGELGSSVTQATGFTLGAGVTGGSGLTALGTVASGNLSNSAIVYPAGHMRLVSSTFTSSGYDFDGTPVWEGTWGAVTVGGITVGSKLFRITQGWFYVDGGGSSGEQMYIYFCGDSFGATTSGLKVSSVGGYAGAWAQNAYTWTGLSPAITTASASYSIYADQTAGSPSKRFNFQEVRHTFFEIYS